MTRVVVAGLGETGALTAIHLARHADVEIVGISTKPGLVSGQELGLRLARPEDWQREYRWSFDRLRGLDRVRTVHGRLVGVDLDRRTVTVEGPCGEPADEPYDVLVISTGVTNGFWRRPDLQVDADVTCAIEAAHQQLRNAGSVLVVGGGAASVSSALHLAQRWPDKEVMLAFPRDRALNEHHPRTWARVRRRLIGAGVVLLSERRAEVPSSVDRITAGPVTWSTGQPSTEADAVLWAIGRVSPNTSWLPAVLLDSDRFVAVDRTLQAPAHPEVFAIGDVAASDPLRSTGRGRADHLLARNIRAHLDGRALSPYRPPRRRWGSVLGYEHDGLRVFTPRGQVFRIPAWHVRTWLQPWVVRRRIWGGVRD